MSSNYHESERLERILDGLADYLVDASDEELLEAARAEGRDPAETTARVKNTLKGAVSAYLHREGLKK